MCLEICGIGGVAEADVAAVVVLRLPVLGEGLLGGEGARGTEGTGYGSHI
jgi:hypothetical protein